MSTLHQLLDDRVRLYNAPGFIEDDPISIPHRYTLLQDREIAGLWTAVLSWGQRKTIVAKAAELMRLMDNSPYDFILHHKESDRKPFLRFVHRTFQPTDALYFLDFFQRYYREYKSLEEAFASAIEPEDPHVGKGLAQFRSIFLHGDHVPARTAKHISSPLKNSSCKRINMFLRWMVRKDDNGVDFGNWQKMRPDQLIIPLDVHVQRVAIGLGLLTRKISDWKAALELTDRLKVFDPTDPVKYDFALFGMGVLEKGP